MATITGTSNDDFLIGTTGNDTISGLAGDDLIDPGTGWTDIVDGGDGFDTLDLSGYESIVVLDGVASGVYSDAFGRYSGDILFSDIEKIVGTDHEAIDGGFKDVFLLQSATHGYTIDAGAGLDLVDLSPFADTITLGADQGDIVRGTLADYDGDTFTDWDNSDSIRINGSIFDASNVIQTSTTTQTTLEIDGDHDGVTDATITVLGDYTDGSFTYVNDGSRTAIYWNSNTGETLVGAEGTNVFRGSFGDDTYYGLGDRDYLWGNTGSDSLYGGDGDDTLNPGTGANDFADGGDGFDTLDLSDLEAAYVVVNGDNGTVYHTMGQVSFSNVEAITGNDGEAVAGYSDYINLRSASHGYTIDAGAGLDYITPSPYPDTFTLGTDQGDLVRSLSLSNYDGDVFTDWDNNDSLGVTGSLFDASDVTITSTATQTVLEIDGDHDGVTDATITLLGDYTDGVFEFAHLPEITTTFITWSSNTGETLTGGEGLNIFRGSLGDDTYYGLGGGDYLRGNAGSDSLYGGDGDDLLYPGTGANDFVDGGDGFDTLNLSGYESSGGNISGAFVFVVAGGTAQSFDANEQVVDQVNFSNIEEIIGTDVDAVSGIAADLIFLRSAPNGFTIDAGDGLDYVFLSPFADTITLGTDQGDMVRGYAMADYDGDVFTDWDNSDSMRFVGFTFDTSNVIQTSSATETVLEIDGDQDGVTDATVTLLGDYTDGAFEFLNDGGDTYIYWNSNTGETLDGREGRNIFRGSLGDDTYNGLGGNDQLQGDAGNDTLNGGDGDDLLGGESGFDTLTGGAGLDSFMSFSPDDFDGDTITDLETGEQLFFQSASFDDGAITLTPGATEAILTGDVDGDGVDDFALTLLGDFSDRGFIATQSDEGTTLTLATVLSAGKGQAAITGTDEAEIIETGNGRGVADGAGGDDLIRGGAGPQNLAGGDGNDQLFGGKSNDVLDGGNGDDRLAGGRGNDTLTGGQDADIFIIEEHGGHDTVTDFEDGLDLIDLSAFGFSDISELTITQNGAHAELQILGGVSVTLENFDATNLDNSDFIFGG